MMVCWCGGEYDCGGGRWSHATMKVDACSDLSWDCSIWGRNKKQRMVQLQNAQRSAVGQYVK